MDRIHKLPFLLGGFMAVVTGVISYCCGSDSQTTYVRMLVFMVVFYVIGIYVRNTIKSIHTELNNKKEQELLNSDIGNEGEHKSIMNDGGHVLQHQEHKVDMVAGGPDDELTPLILSHLISNKTKE